MVALYEAPFIVDNTHAPNDADLGAETQQLIAASRPGDAVKLFIRTVGVPALGLMMMRVMPVWKKLCGVAHTLPNDYALVLEHQQGDPLPAGLSVRCHGSGSGDRGRQEPAVHEERAGRCRCRATEGNPARTARADAHGAW